MDISRRAYSVPCRFFSDNDTVSRVRWMEARPQAEVLPFPSVILSRQQEPDDWLPISPGEVAEAPRTTTLEHSPFNSGHGHICGTETEFAEGESYDPNRPPARYGSLGLPLCCNPLRNTYGGAGASGMNHRYPRRTYSTYGGSGCSGRPTYTPSRPCPPITESGSMEYSVPGDYTFTAFEHGLYRVTCRGPGGSGGHQTDVNFKGGGGGGAFARRDVCLVAGMEYPLHVGTGGFNTDHTTFAAPSPVFVKAASGQNGTDVGGLGGQVADCVGTIRNKGGKGGDAGPPNPGGGGGGGGAAALAGDGFDGAPGTSTTGGAFGASAGPGGGDGGNGGAPGDGMGIDGNPFGGGGGGGGSLHGTEGSGYWGQVVIEWGF